MVFHVWRALLNYLLSICILLFIIDTNCGISYLVSASRTTRTMQRTTRICIQQDKNSLRARHKSCFLRPDTGPCRADIIQYYFDAMFSTCFRFFWGGCQGNGNRFKDKQECLNYCFINSTIAKKRIPHFCSLAFDFGTCFGHYNRWAFDQFSKTCKRRLYSGCGGNQNNFETRDECMSTCLNPPEDTFHKRHKYTTCMPVILNDIY